MEKAKNIITYALVAFALISLGYAWGKNSEGGSESSEVLFGHPGEGQHISVIYMHATIRCDTCDNIENGARGLMDSSYSEAMADGRIHWHKVDFQKNAALARQFGVVSSCVVVAIIKDGEVLEFQRLDEVWTLVSDPPAFDKYISDAVDKHLHNSEDEG
jgi:hypothetical protein